MSSLSVKPDKCAILQETVNQIRCIKVQEELQDDKTIFSDSFIVTESASSSTSSNTTSNPNPNQNQIQNQNQNLTLVASTSTAVQQGEVSSSRPTLLHTNIFGNLLLDALEGFLFVVNGEGKIEFVTDNISVYTKFTREELLGQSIYTILHQQDHARFSSNLLPISASGRW